MGDMPNFDPGAKIGKFPVWVWGAALAGGVLIFTWASRQKGGADVDSPALAETDGALPETGGTGLGGGTQDVLSDFLANLNETLGGKTDPTGGTTSPGGSASGIRNVTATTNAGGVVSTLKTNAGWSAAAVAYLSANGRNALSASRIMAAYLAGRPLSAHSREVLAQAIKGVGTPPQGAPPVRNAKPKKTIKVQHWQPAPKRGPKRTNKPKPKLHHRPPRPGPRRKRKRARK